MSIWSERRQPNQVCQDLKSEIEKSNTVITSDALPAVMADGPQLTKLIRSRIESAIKFSNVEKLRIHISAQQNRTEWVFSVCDNNIGCGDYPGSGIGMALGKKIIERHGGHAWIKPEPGMGTVLYFTIPVRKIIENAH